MGKYYNVSFKFKRITERTITIELVIGTIRRYGVVADVVNLFHDMKLQEIGMYVRVREDEETIDIRKNNNRMTLLSFRFCVFHKYIMNICFQDFDF